MNKLFKQNLRTQHILEGYAFISIWLIGFILFMAVPLGQSLIFSFEKVEYSEQGLSSAFVGLQNYREAFTTDVQFTPRLMTAITIILIQVPLILVFAMFSALLLNKPLKGRFIFRGIFFLPVIIASGAVLQKLLEQGATTLPIFASPNLIQFMNTYIPAQVVVPLFQIMDQLTLVMWDAGVQIIIFLAALQTISPQLYEAAKCDGATPWESFWKITLPMITPMILVNILYSIVNSFTKVNNPLMEYIYDVLFRKSQFGYASALGWIYFIVIFIIIVLVFYMFRNATDTEGRR